MDITFQWVEKQQINNEKIIREVNDFFLKSKANGLEYRESQHKMAIDITNSILNKKYRIVEAGVGIGKTIAYIVPMLIINKYKQRNILISTSSISLEEQLAKDIKKISRQLGIFDLNPVVIKGQRNYLCEHKMSVDNKLNVSKKNKIRKEYEKNKSVVEKYNAEKCTNKTRTTCKYKSQCEYYKMCQSRNGNEKILVCNHNYLINVLLKQTNIKEIDYFICDEAHKLYDVIVESYTKEFMLSDKIEDLSKHLMNLEIAGISSMNKNINTLYNRLILQMKNEIKKSKIETKIKAKNYDKLPFNFKTLEIENISLILYNSIKQLMNMKARVNTDEIEDIIHQLNEDLLVYESLCDKKNDDFLFYANIIDDNIHIYYLPKNTYKLSKNMLDKNKRKLFVFTSATLTTQKNNYDYFLQNMGLTEIQKLEISNSYISPYNYQENMLIYMNDSIANPRNKKVYKNNIIKEIINLINITEGKTLVLFTSKSDLEFVYNKIKNKLKNYKILKQAIGSSQEQVIKEFKDDINSVLLATNYWEGIDVQGISLSQVIIARLPFPTVDAITKNKAEIYGEDIYVNDMIIKIKQGIGRLIRSSTDCGIISILDSRAENKYKEKLKDCIYDSEITLDIKRVKQFVQNKILINIIEN